MLERFFSLKEHQTSVPQEVVAGLTTFAAMAYILAVNPSILSTTGMDKGALITATALASGVMTAVMALATNYPIALAPGMGLNAFFAFTLCGAKGDSLAGGAWPGVLQRFDFSHALCQWTAKEACRSHPNGVEIGHHCRDRLFHSVYRA